MAIDQVDDKAIMHSGDDRKNALVVVAVVLALLAIGEIYAFSRLSTMNQSMQDSQAALRKDLTTQIGDRMTALEQSNARVVDALKQDIEETTARAGANETSLRRERAALKKFQDDQAKTADEVKQELAKKADQEQVGALSGAVTNTRQDLDATKKTVEQTRNDLGMARSELGTLIARNHDDIEYLRKLGQRDYFEFTMQRNKPIKVAGVGLILKKTNVKHHLASFVLVANDMDIQKKNRSVDEPIFFSVQGSKTFYELVLNSVQSGTVKGYISTPKGAATEVATR